MAVSDSGLDFQTAALAIGLVGGLTFLIAQARSYLDRAISDTRLEVIRQEAELQRARASNSIYLAGRLTLARYSNGPRLAEVVIQATKGLIRRPLPAENAQPAIFERRAAWWNRHGMSADLSRTQSALDDYSRRSQAHSLDEPSGISISFVILFSAIIFSLSVAALMMAMLLSVGWSHLSAHPAVTGITVVVLAAFMVFLAAIAWLTARDAVFELVMLSGSESVTISRWLKSSADHLGRMHIAERFPDGKASSIVTERDLSLRGCASALRIYPLIGQALHIQGVLCAAELEEIIALGFNERSVATKGIYCLSKLPDYLVPIAGPGIPDPRLCLGWLLQRQGDDRRALDNVIAYLRSGDFSASEYRRTASGRVWLEAYGVIAKASPELVTQDLFFACADRLRDDKQAWAQIAVSFAGEGAISRGIVLAAAKGLIGDAPEDPSDSLLRDLVEQLEAD